MYKYFIARHFKKQMKPYVKKFNGVFSDIIFALTHFNKTQSINLGEGLYKIRLSVTKLKKGKSKSFRLIIYLIESDSLIIPIAFFSKNKKANMKLKKIKHHVNKIKDELSSWKEFVIR